MPPHEQAFLLFQKYGGRSHERIQKEMRELGYERFSRRSLYSYTRDGERRPGWIERYGWKTKVERGIRNAESGMKTKGGNPTCSEGVEKCEMSNAECGIDTAECPPPAAHGQPPPADSFPAWLRATAPTMQWDARHQQIIYEHLQRVTSGETKRLMIFMPPRHGKSELVTIRYAAWRLRQNPKMRVVIGSYNQHLANKFSRTIRRVLAEEEDEEMRNSAGNAGTLACMSPQGENQRSANGRPPTAKTPHSSFRDPHSRMFPRSRNINTMAEWETAVGGGVKAVGVGAGITGFGAELVVIDDPVKSRAQAESATFRDRIWDWFRDDICTRLEPDAPMILIQTRWHEDDLAGRILNEMKTGGEQWSVLSLPAIAEPGNAGTHACMSLSKGESDQTYSDGEDEMKTKDLTTHGTFEQHAQQEEISRKAAKTQSDTSPPSANGFPPTAEFRSPGEALWPERFPAAALLERKERIGSYSFASLYQQHPSPAEGGHFKREWFRRIVEAPPPGLQWFRGYDLAVSTKTTADFTASFRVACDSDGNYYIADGYRKRMEFPEQRRYIVGRMTGEKNTSHGVEAALHGSAVVQDIEADKSFSHIPLKAVRLDSDKLTRALGWANHAEAGKVALVRGGWIGEFIEELAAFPNGRHDDQIDAVSLAFRMLAEGKRYKTRGY